VTGLPPPDAGALAFAAKLMTVLAHGLKTATYKYAVLLGLIDLCYEESSLAGRAPRTVHPARLAAKVIELYWPHTLPYGQAGDTLLRQNTGGRQAEIIQLIRRFRAEDVGDASASLTTARLRAPAAWDRLVARVEWKLVEMPLPKLQRVGTTLDPFLYRIDWTDDVRRAAYLGGDVDRRIRFVGDAADHLLRLAPLLRPIIQSEWTRLVAQLNRERVSEGALEVNRPGFAGGSIPWEDWSHGKTEQVFAGGPRAGRADGPRASGRLRLGVGGDAIHRVEDRLYGRDAPEVGPAG